MRILSLLFALLFFTRLHAQQKGGQQPLVISYYSGSLERLDSFDVSQMTHLIYCFGHLRENRFHLDGRKDTLMVQKMVALKKQNPQLKVLLSLGGWGGCAPCSDMAATAAGRQAFARSVQQVSRFLGADGIDLDWGYPAIEGHPGHRFVPADKQNFTLLVAELRKQMGKKATISFAAGGFQKFINESVEWEKVMPMVDFVNLMTYDLVNGYATQTGHHTPLYSTPQQTESTDNAVQMLRQKGVPANKMVLGAAFYSRVWEGVPDQNNGLYQPGKFKTATAYRHFIQTMTPENGYAFFWDSTAQAPYAYNKAQGLFATFDDKRSLSAKTTYVLQQGLRGIMYWELGSDLYTGGLLEAIRQTIDSQNRK